MASLFYYLVFNCSVRVYDFGALSTLLFTSREDLYKGGVLREPLRQPFTNPFGMTERIAHHKAVTGLKARVRWWQRIVSLVGLVIVIGLLGVMLAFGIGLLVLIGRILLDVIVS